MIKIKIIAGTGKLLQNFTLLPVKRSLNLTWNSAMFFVGFIKLLSYGKIYLFNLQP